MQFWTIQAEMFSVVKFIHEFDERLMEQAIGIDSDGEVEMGELMIWHKVVVNESVLDFSAKCIHVFGGCEPIIAAPE